jgi:hypothetical protein
MVRRGKHTSVRDPEVYAGIDYAKLAEKLREELRGLDLRNLTDIYNQLSFSKGRELGIVFKRPISLSRKLFLYLQHLGSETYRFDTSTYAYVMLTRAVPSDEVNGVDYIEASVTETSETLKIDQRFVMAEDIQDDLVIRGLATAVATVGVKGDGTYATYISKLVFTIEKVDTAGNYTTLSTKTVTLSPPFSTTGTSWVYGSVEALLKITEVLTTNERLALRVQVYGYMAAGGTAQAARLVFTRGSSDSYLEVPVWED